MALNVEQQRAADCEDNLLVLAPPGSGKTGTLVEKTKLIIERIPNSRVCLVTFTDASAKEAHERISRSLTQQQIRRVSVATFHKHAMEQLRKAGKLGRILSPGESTGLLRQSLAEVGSTMDIMEAESKMQAHKATPDFTGREEDFIEVYEQKKHTHRAVDLQDVIRDAVVGMRSTNMDKHVAPLNVTHVLCDEFQDVDWNQLHWLLCYHSLGAIVTVVGDDDQSVYSWRNSLGYDAMLEFIERVKPQVINLEVNYRSKKEILLSATKLIRNNPKRMEKVIVSKLGDGGEVIELRAADKEAEAAKVVDLIVADCAANGYEPTAIPNQRWGIIARTNRDLWMVSIILRNQGIPFVKSQKKDEAPREIMLFCSFLVSVQTNDTLGLRDTLSALGIGERTLRNTHERLKDDFFAIMDGEFPGSADLENDEKAILKPFLHLCPVWRAATAEGRYDYVIGAIGAFFLTHIVRGDDVVADFKNFVGLLSGERTRAADSSSDTHKSIRKRPRGNLQVRVLSFFRQEDKPNAGGVSLFTMHGSKGLEFDNVFVAQCNSGTIPSAKSTNVDEERRLFYVAMTRARHQLTMCSITAKGRSPFLGEIT
jgi:superfamily I DNA/RNA helicase